MDRRTITSIIYPQATAPPRSRTKPMAVLCVGWGRSATTSLSIALEQLGYTPYHAQHMFTEQPPRMRQWTLLADQKYGRGANGDSKITRKQLDDLMGQTDAVIDTIGYHFTSEIIEAYPEAKVILNYREDLESWHRSLMRTIAAIFDSWAIWFISTFSAEPFWIMEFNRVSVPGLYRGGAAKGLLFGMQNCGKWVYREHCAMVRGLMIGQEERFLEWRAQDGWEPLCKFLEKDIPAGDFPRANDTNAFHEDVNEKIRHWLVGALVNSGIFASVAVAGAVMAARYAGVRVPMPSLQEGVSSIKRLIW